MVPGAAFFPGNPPTPYVRAAFSTASPAELEEAMARLGQLLRARQHKAGAAPKDKE
jgi:kynurenine/2-aminoadipate aminotransferase